MITKQQAMDFQTESNRIEGIDGASEQEALALQSFVNEPLTVEGLCEYVSVCQPGAVLREKRGQNVRVGTHVAPPGGPQIRPHLEMLLGVARDTDESPYVVHRQYENLHPFTDGNGRSGRALWLWQMLRRDLSYPRLGFLHTWYYQSLDNGDRRFSPFSDLSETKP